MNKVGLCTKAFALLLRTTANSTPWFWRTRVSRVHFNKHQTNKLIKTTHRSISRQGHPSITC